MAIGAQSMLDVRQSEVLTSAVEVRGLVGCDLSFGTIQADVSEKQDTTAEQYRAPLTEGWCRVSSL